MKCEHGPTRLDLKPVTMKKEDWPITGSYDYLEVGEEGAIVQAWYAKGTPEPEQLFQVPLVPSLTLISDERKPDELMFFLCNIGRIASLVFDVVDVGEVFQMPAKAINYSPRFEDIDVETGELMGPPAWEKKKKKKGKHGHS